MSRQAALPRDVKVFSLQARRTLAAGARVQTVTASRAVEMAGTKPDPYCDGKKHYGKNGEYDFVPASEELLQRFFMAPGALRA